MTVAIRTFYRQKIFTFINISGLAVGLAGALLIIGYIIDELTYDAIHPHASDTYRIGVHRIFEDGNEAFYQVAPAVWSNQLKEQYQQVKTAMRTMWFGYPSSVTYKAADKIILTEELFFVESNYPEVLYFESVIGMQNDALKDNNSIALSESAAKLIFGSEDPIGKLLVVKHPFATSDREIALVVTSVFKDYPSNTHFKPSCLVNIESLKPVMEWGNYEDLFTGWLQGFMNTYVVLEEDADASKLEEELQVMVKEHLSEQAGLFVPFFKNVRDLHFDRQLDWSSEGSADFTYVLIFGSIALLLVLIACINYMNLATARSVKRSREVGLRKVFGSKKAQLIFQFINESFITTALSLILAILLIFLALPLFNTISQKHFEFLSFFNVWVFGGLVLLLFVVSMLAGSYPAFYLSKFKPVLVLKGGKINVKGSDALRKSLVILQFSISFFMVICTGVLLKQVNFLNSSKLNEAGEQVVSIRYGGTAPDEKYPVFKNLLSGEPGIGSVTMANHLPRQNYFGGIGITVRIPELGDQEYSWSELNVDFNFPSTFNLEFLAGRDFDPLNPADSNTCIINESAVKSLGMELEEVIGVSIQDDQQECTVIGVVKDFPYRSMHQTIDPLRISARPHPVDKIVYVRIPSENVQKHLKTIETSWKEVFPGVGFDYWFLNQEFGRMYESETRMSDLTKVFSGVAIFIACLGLFGLASYMAEQKTKEIGIRKVLGASISQILIMFLRTFARMLLLAVIIAGPVAYFLMNEWLQQFAYHIVIDWKIIASGISVIFTLTILTVSYELVKASTANPANSIRYE